MKKKLLFFCFAIFILFQSYFVFAERIIFTTPIPKPKLSIEKALKLARAELEKNLDGSVFKSSDMVVQSVEYCSYNGIINKYNVEDIKTNSKEGNWEWIIKLCNTKVSDDWVTYMVTQNGKVLLVELCCL